MKHVFQIDSVEEGMVTQNSIIDPQSGVLLVPAGTILTDKYISILKRRGVKEIEVSFINNSSSENIINNEVVTGNPLLMKETCHLLDKLSSDSTNIEDVMENAGKIVDDALIDTKLNYHLSDFRMNKEPSNHAIRVAAFATAVAKEYNKQFDNINITKEREERQIPLEQIAVSALLHDVGKLCSDKEVRYAINNYIDLSKTFEGLKDKSIEDLKETYDENYVSYYGYNIIHDNRKISQSSKAMVLLSKEDEMGTGPLKAKALMNIKERDSHVTGAKIINMCSLFDEYLMKAIKEHGNLENVYKQMASLVILKKFSEELLGMLINAIPLYSKGTIDNKVELNQIYNDQVSIEKIRKQKLNDMLVETEELHGKAM